MSIKNWWRKLTGKPESHEGARPQGYILDEMPRPAPRREPAPKQDLEAQGRERRVSQARTRAPQPQSRPRRSNSTYDATSDLGGGYIGYGSSYDSTPSSSGGDCGGSSYGGSSSSSDSGGSSSCDSGGSY